MQLFPTYVVIGEAGPYPARVAPGAFTGNGYLRPYFTRAVAEQVAADANALPEDTSDAIRLTGDRAELWSHADGGPRELLDTVQAEDGLYRLADGFWCWQEPRKATPHLDQVPARAARPHWSHWSVIAEHHEDPRRMAVHAVHNTAGHEWDRDNLLRACQEDDLIVTSHWTLGPTEAEEQAREDFSASYGELLASLTVLPAAEHQ